MRVAPHFVSLPRAPRREVDDGLLWQASRETRHPAMDAVVRSHSGERGAADEDDGQGGDQDGGVDVDEVREASGDGTALRADGGNEGGDGCQAFLSHRPI